MVKNAVNIQLQWSWFFRLWLLPQRLSTAERGLLHSIYTPPCMLFFNASAYCTVFISLLLPCTSFFFLFCRAIQHYGLLPAGQSDRNTICWMILPGLTFRSCWTQFVCYGSWSLLYWLRFIQYACNCCYWSNFPSLFSVCVSAGSPHFLFADCCCIWYLHNLVIKLPLSYIQVTYIVSREEFSVLVKILLLWYKFSLCLQELWMSDRWLLSNLLDLNCGFHLSLLWSSFDNHLGVLEFLTMSSVSRWDYIKTIGQHAALLKLLPI